MNISGMCYKAIGDSEWVCRSDAVLTVGRRVCVGWNVGLRNMYMVFSRLLYCFDFIQDSVCLLLTVLTPERTD
jgi:hypothetical protein